MFKPKTTIIAATAVAIGLLGAAPLAQAGIKVPERHPEGIKVPDGIRVPDGHRHIIGVLRVRSASFEPNTRLGFEPNFSLSFEPNLVYPPGPTGA